MTAESPVTLAVHVSRRRNDATVWLNGELDSATVDHVESKLRALVVDGVETIVVDLARMTFIDSAGVRALVAAELDGRITVVGARPPVRRVFDALTQRA